MSANRYDATTKVHKDLRDEHIMSSKPYAAQSATGARRMSQEEFDIRMRAARKRAQYELGDPAYAGLIISAFMCPEDDTAALEQELSA